MPRAWDLIRGATSRVLGGKRSVAQLVKKDTELLDRVADLVVRGVVKPRIARTIELEDVAAALDDLERGRVHGKLVVQIP